MPTMVAGLPGMEALAGRMMRKKMGKLEIPGTREMLQILEEAGCELYACQLAMEMFGYEPSDLVPQVKGVITAGDFYDLSEGSQIIFT
jgi:peroxiredoxin family protein